MKRIKNQIILTCTTLVLVFFSCKKDNKVIGVDVQPPADALSAEFDSNTPVYAYTIKTDSTASYNTRYKFLGSNVDPYFGKTDIGLYLNANMSVSDLNFGSNPVLSSAEIVLAIDIGSFQGGINEAISYSVFTIDSSLSASRVYFTNNTRLHSQSGFNKASVSTYTLLNGVQVIRIPVDSAFASNMISSPQYLASNDVFQAKYKGFYIKCANQPGSQGVIYKCNLDHEQSGFYVRYKPGTAPSDTLRSFRFTFSGSSAARFNTVSYDYSQASGNLKSQLQGDTSAGQENLYAKGMSVTKVKIRIPKLVSYADSFKIAVNRAELIVNIDKNFIPATGTYTAPPKLSLLPLDSAGKETFALDQLNPTDRGRYDGGYDSDKNRYVFNIARHVQAILNGSKKNYGFHLVVTDPDPVYTALRDAYIERVVFAGSNNGTLKPLLNLSFIKFRND